MINVRDKVLCAAFGKRLRHLRSEAGLTQEQLANEADVSISQISRLERGLINPTLSTLNAIADALDITLVHIVSDIT